MRRDEIARRHERTDTAGLSGDASCDRLVAATVRTCAAATRPIDGLRPRGSAEAYLSQTLFVDGEPAPHLAVAIERGWFALETRPAARNAPKNCHRDGSGFPVVLVPTARLDDDLTALRASRRP